jgi:ubiquitin carboxyl-terminal hydrolase 48
MLSFHAVYDRSQDSVIISRQALERWLSKPLAKPKTKPKGVEESETTLEILPTSDVLCQHDALDPQRANNMKRVSAVSPSSNIMRSTKSESLERL